MIRSNFGEYTSRTLSVSHSLFLSYIFIILYVNFWDCERIYSNFSGQRAGKKRVTPVPYQSEESHCLVGWGNADHVYRLICPSFLINVYKYFWWLKLWLKITHQKEKNEMWLVTNHVPLGNVDGSNTTKIYIYIYWWRLKANYFNTMWYLSCSCVMWNSVSWVFTI